MTEAGEEDEVQVVVKRKQAAEEVEVLVKGEC
jgi:hypothetical protein